MNRLVELALVFMASVAIGTVDGAAVPAQSESKAIATTAIQQETAMTQHAKGTFDVKLLSLAADVHGPDSPIARKSNDKQFHGDIEGSSKGQMLMIGTAVEGSAAYVSIEVVSATLNGRSGSFALQHSGTMTRGVGQLSITVVPDSGTGALQGIAGVLTISIEAGVHAYDFAYTLPAVE